MLRVIAGQAQPASPIKPLDVPIPALEPGQQPNFIVIVTDDQVCSCRLCSTITQQTGM
jgi:hypothetical protein